MGEFMMKYVSETGRHRSFIIAEMQKHFGTLEGLNGVDIGFGGDPVLPNSISMDMPEKYTTNVIQTGHQHLFGDCRNMYWFADGVMDYVYSSHVLEDLDETEIKSTFEEWTRILKPNGLLILNLPDEKKYRAVCAERGYRSNPRHKILDMSPSYVVCKVETETMYLSQIIYDLPPDGYSFLMIWRKM
jgi:predicted SAM-dependent methyltransferase